MFSTLSARRGSNHMEKLSKSTIHLFDPNLVLYTKQYVPTYYFMIVHSLLL